MSRIVWASPTLNPRHFGSGVVLESNLSLRHLVRLRDGARRVASTHPLVPSNWGSEVRFPECDPVRSDNACLPQVVDGCIRDVPCLHAAWPLSQPDFAQRFARDRPKGARGSSRSHNRRRSNAGMDPRPQGPGPLRKCPQRGYAHPAVAGSALELVSTHAVSWNVHCRYSPCN